MRRDIKIDPSTLLNEMIWPATRYCIGRHSYVSSYAETYWGIIRRYRENFNEERLQCYARDIKDNIAQTMRWWENIEVEGTGNDCIKFDPYSLLSRYLFEHPGCDFASNDFEINCLHGVVRVYKRDTPLTESQMTFCKVPDIDLAEWSKLASCISNSFKVDIEGKEIEVIKVYNQTRYSVDEPWKWELELRLVDNWKRVLNVDYLIKVNKDILKRIEEKEEEL